MFQWCHLLSFKDYGLKYFKRKSLGAWSGLEQLASFCSDKWNIISWRQTGSWAPRILIPATNESNWIPSRSDRFNWEGKCPRPFLSMMMMVSQERPDPMAKRIATPAGIVPQPFSANQSRYWLSYLQRFLGNLMWKCGMGLVGLRYVPTICIRWWTIYILHAERIFFTRWITTNYSRISRTLYLVETYISMLCVFLNVFKSLRAYVAFTC